MAKPQPPEQKTSDRVRSHRHQDRKEIGPSFTNISSDRMFQLLLAFRLLNALTTRTFFQPDEYYQALEPAWNAAFGAEGHAWTTWEWHEHLRSSLHPALFAIAYRVADLIVNYLSLGPNSQAEVLLATPKVLQAVVAATGDFYTWKLAERVYGPASKIATTALMLTILNPWQWFCSTRTFSNGLETTLTVAALSCWPFTFEKQSSARGDDGAEKDHSQHSGHQNLALEEKISYRLGRAMLLAAFATLLRPTNIIIWASLSLYAFIPMQPTVTIQNSTSPVQLPPPKSASETSHNKTKAALDFAIIFEFCKTAFICGSAALLISVSSDYLFFGQLTFPPVNFLVFNVIKSLAVFYGNNDWHYYLSQGYPLLLTTALPFTLVGMFHILANSSGFQTKSTTTRRALSGLTLISVTLPLALSVLSHKEVRFIYPLLPAFHVLAAAPLWNYFGPILSKETTTSIPTTTSTKVSKWILMTILLLINAIIAMYTTQVHNSGLLSVQGYLRNQYERHYHLQDQPRTQNTYKSMTVAFFMPCHSVPWRSHLQYPPSAKQPGIKAWALTCEPPLHINEPEMKSKYRDEADLFYDDPQLWVRKNMARSMPDGVIDNRGTHVRRTAGVHVDPSSKQKKKLWGRPSSRDIQEVDILDLLPYLSTWNPDDLDTVSQRDTNEPDWKRVDHTGEERHDKTLSPETESEAGEERNEDSSPAVTQDTTERQSINKISSTERSNRLKQASQQGTSPSSASQIRRPWPHYLVFFAHLEQTMASILRGTAYRQCQRQFNSHWHDDWRRTGDVIVWCLRPDMGDSGDGFPNVGTKAADADANVGVDAGFDAGVGVDAGVNSNSLTDDEHGTSQDRKPKQFHSSREVFLDQRANTGRNRLSSGQRALNMLNWRNGE